MKLLITGDFVINKKYSSELVSNEVLELFGSSNFNIVNLEAPVTENEKKIVKTGPHLKAARNGTLSVLKALNINLVSLANNHILDYDEQGVLDTINFCKENSIGTVGAGKNKEEAAKPFYINSEEGTIAILNFAENEWASATDTSSGANGMDLIDNVKQIKIAQASSDFVFVIVHGGHEYYNLPSPRMVKLYRFYAESGADLVVGHHSHCISGSETYKGVPIFYSLGNFLFTRDSDFDDWYLGLVLEIELDDSGGIRTNLHPVKLDMETLAFNLLDGNEKLNVIQRVAHYSEVIGDDQKLKIEWLKYLEVKANAYLSYWSPLSFIPNKYVRYLLGPYVSRLGKRGFPLLLNLLRCEAHADISKAILSRKVRSMKR